MNTRTVTKDAPQRISSEMVDKEIASEQYFHSRDTTLVVCVITLQNGYPVTGETSCSDPADQNHDVARDIAKGMARQKVFALLAFRLADEIHREKTARKLAREVLQNSEHAKSDPLIAALTGAPH